MADIDEIRQQMFDDLGRRVKEDQRLGQIRRSIQAGDYSRAAEYGARCGEILSSVLRSNMEEEAFQEFSVEDLGRLMMPVIQREFEYVSNAVTASQRAQNEETGIGIQPLRSELNASEYYNIFGKMKSYGSFRNASYLLDEPIALNSLETVDDAIRQNAEFQSAAGLKVKMIRTAEAGCCEFCDERAGEYEFPNVPDTAWERHNNCRCDIRIETEKETSRRVVILDRSDVRDRIAKSKEDERIWEDIQARRREGASKTVFSEEVFNDPIALSANKYLVHSDQLYSRADKVIPEPGYDDVFIHGDEYDFCYYDQNGVQIDISVEHLAELLQEYGNFENDKIRLCSCGSGAPSASAAQLLANLLGKEVLAPTKTLFVLGEKDGVCDMIVADEDEYGHLDENNLGTWKPFYPR